MVIINPLILFVAAILAGTLNAVAGGGSFIGFPTLIYVNVAAKLANTTNTMALWPGSLAAAVGLRKELASQDKLLLLVLSVTSVLGGIGGAYLLLNTQQATFERLIPFLLLAATILFAVSPQINARLKRRAAQRYKASKERGEQTEGTRTASTTLIGVAILQLIIAVYGGYFGGGIGILMLASLGIIGMENIHEMNAVKNMLATCINGVAVITFIANNAIVWPDALIMIAGALIGGYGGARYARKIDPKLIRSFVIVVGCVLTVVFFFKYEVF